MGILSGREARKLGFVGIAGFILLVFYHLYGRDTIASFPKTPVEPPRHPLDIPDHRPLKHLGDSHDARFFGNRHLTTKQCQAAFPGLTKDIDDMVALGPFPIKQARDLGPLQVRLKEQKLSIIHKEADGMLSKGYVDARISTLHQIHRAILSSPELLPDTILSINVLDGPANDTFSYSRPAFAASKSGSPPVTRAFLMPHFSFWAWPLPFVGSFRKAAAAIDQIESDPKLPFAAKDRRPVWRGTKRYNSAQYPQMRTDLLRVAANAAWADVEELAWDAGGQEKMVDAPGSVVQATTSPVATNALLIEDFCRYKYIIHTEGITYSGRLQFHQLCESVILTPPIAWLQHTTHLVKPLFSSDVTDIQPKNATLRWTPTMEEKKAWPKSHFADANMVFVAPDWSDLQATVEWLEREPAVAAGIARRQRQLFSGGGYLSPAAEACYWRALIRGWSKVAQTKGQGWEQQEGVPWEVFSLGGSK